MRRSSMERFRPWVMAAVLLVGGCGSDVPAEDASSEWIEITTQSGRTLDCLDELRVNVASDLIVEGAEGWELGLSCWQRRSTCTT